MCGNNLFCRMERGTICILIALAVLLGGLAWFLLMSDGALPEEQTKEVEESRPRPSTILWYKIERIITSTTTMTMTPIFSSTIYPATFDVNRKDSEGNTTLHRVAEQGDEAAIRELIRLGADVNLKNKVGQTPLHKAAARAGMTCGNETVTLCFSVIIFLEEHGAKIDAQDNYGRIFIHHMLASNESSHVTPAQLHHIAVKYDHIFSVRDNLGETLLHVALECVKVEISTLSLLYKKAVDFKAVTNLGWTVLVSAIRGHQSAAVMSKLIEYGADYRRLTSSKDSLLHVAAYCGHPDALAFFIGEGDLDINGKNKFGCAPLHGVGLRNKNSKPLEVTRLLLGNGASKTMKTNLGKTPYDVVKDWNFQDKDKVLELLR